MSLKIRHISDAVNSSLSYIEGRMNGSIKSLKTSFNKLNDALLEGIEWNKIFTIGGMSGAGKSMLCEQLKRDIVTYNNEPVKILSFEFEMPSYEQVTRNISGTLNISVKDLYTNLDQEGFEKVVKVSRSISRFPIYYVDDVGSVDQIVETINTFIENNKDIKEGKTGLIVTIDHVLLTSGKMGQTEREVIAHLYRTIVGFKKHLISNNIKCLFILLSQLNREIESIERKMNPEYHYPNRNDLFGSNDIFMGSDYVLVIHKPAILNLVAYGDRGFPIYQNNIPLIYFHLLKHRSGEPRILTMKEDFRNSKIIETTL